ncbi:MULTISPECIES: pyridoxal phosphate-dependent aminotransferase [Rhodanobacter]|uniref:pyridoxal phosphate-dependent aminotransferase n=1 Tax=Rhodanobacter TaxID=75309 RepID=UPI00040D9C7E|nr:MULTISPECIES: pyridoxal phosphate-dependent aminotransferase [Rhodanobacter]KZC20454.1 methionine aminotransferase [Rhodanobacter denitrificans]UJJ52544.1 pyridoxal phosphate-dependent aminotransferase [Rhodanobacter denitrificans]UJM95298.1 pyridoxal phosphate-dependent aminotransferase [Rhodanobacter denitrificans]UJM98829.1 pyridoxal phosphate-dependent aminotransferase [Rhodanobacter denitrificans]UJN21756.1 pyridoxal phosphate-dependent aminotransferase [Rhodanobacter denitrificans]
MIATKLPKVGTTIFSVMSQLALERKAVNLGQGFPDFEPPQGLRDALGRAMNEGRNQYAPMHGIAALREQIVLKTERLYGRRLNVDTDITLTSGATEAIFAAIAATVRAGEEVIVFDPAYDCYEPAIELQGARAMHIPLTVPTFAIDWQRVRDAVTSKTRMIMINSPHNPSGAVLSAADLDELAAIVRETEIVVLSDEVYEHIVYDGAHESVLRHPELAGRSIVVSSFGKTYHCTGWKVGYAVAPAALSAEFRKVHQYLTFCTFHPAQAAFAEFMASDPQHYLELPAFYQAKRDRFRALLAPSRFKLLDVPGGYFQLVDYSAIRDEDDLAFSRWLVEHGGVAAIPLTPFYERAPGTRLLRLCFAKSDATMEAAAERLCRL